MKKITLLVLLLALFGMATVSEATVIIYKGTGKFLRGDSVQAKTVSTTLFFVVDFNTLQGDFVFAQTIAGLKTIYDDGTRNYGIAEVKNSANSSTVYYTSADGAFNNATSFTFRGFRMGGKKANVFLKAGDPLPATIPKTVVGSYSFATGTPHVIDGPFTMSVDLKRTQFSNQNNLTTSQAIGAIINEYTAAPKNYTSATPNP